MSDQKKTVMKRLKLVTVPGMILVVIAILTLSWVPVNPENVEIKREEKLTLSSEMLLEQHASTIYWEAELHEKGLKFEVFEKAYIGYLNLQGSKHTSLQSHVLSIADFSQSSKKKRLWIVDLNNSRLILNTWVSHGRGSGGEMATKFSNTNNSHQSSLGFYLTGEVYYGKHGRSLRLDGMDSGFNDNARQRAIVLHGASYVSQSAINSLNRLGLSHGCPAVPLELTDEIIDVIKNKTVFYIHADYPSYRSVYLNTEKAGRTLIASSNPDEDIYSGI